MTVVVTRDVPDRYRGFLASAMLEIAPGVYTAPRMTKAVRERIWAVLEDWFLDLPGGSIVMTWKESSAPGGQAVATLGLPPKELAVLDGIHLCRGRHSDLTPDEIASAPRTATSGGSEPPH